MSDSLKKPVHVALLRKTQLEKLAEQGKISKTAFGVDPNSAPVALPVEKVERHKIEVPKSDLVKKSKIQIKLKVLHDNVPPIPKDKKPPCESCVAVCCVVFAVNISQLEYESGLYGDAAVKLTPEIQDQLKSRLINVPMLTMPKSAKAGYYLEGKIGEPCPFLSKDKKCTIYDIRPVTCRAYTCVGDDRITDGMRNGSEPIDGFSVIERMVNKDAK